MLQYKTIRGAFALMLISIGLHAHAEFLRCNGDSAQEGDNKAAGCKSAVNRLRAAPIASLSTKRQLVSR
ncbi:hypothetical protein CSQ89_05145 [Chitinimonas sp. BJB300]|nr:hypothetical protein CSQ89_05145 [Chitinimonas sp. BJB300]